MPFAKGAPKPAASGKKKGSLNKATITARKLVEADDKAIIGKVGHWRDNAGSRGSSATGPDSADCCRSSRPSTEVTGEIIEHVDPIFFGGPKTAAFKALGLN